MIKYRRMIKNITTITFLLILIFLRTSYAEENIALSNVQVVKNTFSVFSNINATSNDFQKSMSKNYIQISDGHKLNYPEFLSHVQALHHMMKSIHFKFIQVVSDGNIVATHHIAYGVKKNGKIVETEFFAFFTIKNHKIVNCQEMSRMIKGSKNDKDLSYTKNQLAK